MVIGILQVLSTNVYALLDPGAKFSFVTTLLPKKFDVIPDFFNEPLSVKTPVGDSVFPRRVFRSFPLSFPNRFT